MSEELIQRDLVAAPDRMGAWDYYNIGSTTLKALKAAKIIPKRDYADYEAKKPDALVTKKPLVIATIEYKQPSQLKTKKQINNAIQQELGTARALGAKVYIVTDGKKTFWINPLTGNPVLSDDKTPVAVNFNRHSEECVKLITRMMSSLSKDNDTLLASAVVDPLPLAQQVWQDLWAVSGATPENCLYTFVEIFIFKYLSDLGVLHGFYSFYDLLSRYGSNTENAVLEYYANTIRPEIKRLFPRSSRDNTTIINGTIFVSKDEKAVDGYAAVFKKILERFDKFGTLENIDYDFKSKLFETFLKESISKKNWGQFFTPLKVVRSIVSMADIRPGMSICDPACGVGKFLLEPILHDINRYYKIEDGKLKPQITLSGFDKGFDRDEQKTIILAKANMLIYLSALIRDNPGITVDFANLFNETFLLQTNSILGTLAHPTENVYDLILTNPPYVMSGSSNLKDEIAKQEDLKEYYSINAMGIEGLFMEWIVRALKPGGKAFVVVPDGIMNRSNDKRLRDFILDECDIDAVISLPINTFFTTNKKTYILAITKKTPTIHDGIEKKERQTRRVFTYLCSEIGETRDVYRFDLEQNDLAEAAKQFNMFKGNKEYFSTTDRRCKLVDIDAFYTGAHWSVERWWTREERIDLGIEDEIKSVSIEGFIALVEDTAATLSDFQEPLREIAKKKIQVRNSVEVSLSDNTLFQLSIGKRVLRKDFQTPRGEIPVYSANVFSPFVYSDTSNIVDYDAPYVIWGIDGVFEFNVVGMGRPFATTDHCGAIKILDPNIDPFYLAYMLREKSHIYGFDRGLRASLTNMKNVKIAVPIDDIGSFNIEYQRFIARQLESVGQVKKEIEQKENRIASVAFNINTDAYSMAYKPLSEVLEPVKGKSLYTRKYGESHKGNYPVFSASSSTPLTYIDTFDYNGDFLSWSTNGFAGTVIVLSGQFSINGDRGLLIPKIENIDILYLRYVLEPIFRGLAKGRRGDRGEDEFTKLYPSMIRDVEIPLPVDKNGSISLSAQKEIAAMYDSAEQYRHEIIAKLDGLLNQRIEY